MTTILRANAGSMITTSLFTASHVIHIFPGQKLRFVYSLGSPFDRKCSFACVCPLVPLLATPVHYLFPLDMITYHTRCAFLTHLYKIIPTLYILKCVFVMTNCRVLFVS